ncbi:hypothetical protein J2W42_002746 [Rhizobium tibeticum]|nr:hypothetical protein [Rhizobium tibeticum]
MSLIGNKFRVSLLLAGLAVVVTTAGPSFAGQSMQMRKTDGSANDGSSSKSESKPLELPPPPPPLPEKQRCVQVTYQCGDTTCTGVRCQ